MPKSKKKVQVRDQSPAKDAHGGKHGGSHHHPSSGGSGNPGGGTGGHLPQ